MKIPNALGVEMREYILTDQERKIIKRYLETGEKLEGFKVLLHRCRHMQVITGDLSLIEQFLKKTSQ